MLLSNIYIEGLLLSTSLLIILDYIQINWNKFIYIGINYNLQSCNILVLFGTKFIWSAGTDFMWNLLSN